MQSVEELLYATCQAQNSQGCLLNEGVLLAPGATCLGGAILLDRKIIKPPDQDSKRNFDIICGALTFSEKS